MALPILVPALHELPLLGLRTWPVPTRRRFSWRPCPSLHDEGWTGRHGRHGRFAQPTAPAIRQALLERWQRRCVVWTRPQASVAIAWRPRTSSGLRTLLWDAGSVLNSLLRRRRKRMGIRPRALTALASTFDSQRWRLRVDAHQHAALAMLLCTMYWRGFRHPASLESTPLHPPTTLVRWLSRFTVQQQADHGRQILDALIAEEARVHAWASELVRRMLPERGAASRWIALLPELLKRVEQI